MESLATDQPITLKQIQTGVCERKKAFQLLNRYSADNPYREIGLKAGHWFETTEEVYWYFLEVLPPSFMDTYGFINCECVTHNLYDGFVETKGRYFSLMTFGPGQRPFAELARRLIAEVSS